MFSILNWKVEKDLQFDRWLSCYDKTPATVGTRYLQSEESDLDKKRPSAVRGDGRWALLLSSLNI